MVKLKLRRYFDYLVLLIGLSPALYILLTLLPLTPIADRFHFRAKPLSEGRFSLTDIERASLVWAMRKFPSLSECESEASDAEKIILNWDRMRNLPQARICLFHLAEHFKSPLKLVDWLEKEGFRSSVLDSRGNWPTDREFLVSAHGKENGEGISHLNGSRVRLAHWRKAPVGISIRYSKGRVPLSAYISVSWE